ncbi:RICIN domain-containing protein [Pseudobacteroides cellulosolvens]|uniref:Glucan endo-1,3-beta-D-glucosidase n=1 Tax=Pseudobacteroides cellulosolvens ATCC 35603 = DSM 2933 TaxID=398512 RepID=A0A0L6JKX8_9FIRM|nr:RICIN domain-containing protein [Pseudobacteroides cellulosolvens]KNY26476.1 Glucan endo-1,3-beta-D-glucosidase [Pseudobacteroides cellulosolvens ATCC 35603 = DSM 2933]
MSEIKFRSDPKEMKREGNWLKNCRNIFVMLIISLSTCILVNSTANAAIASLTNGTQFKDTSGNVIHAHGGSLLKYGNYYYWYGEYRDGSNYFLGVRCYRSTDLMNWEYRGEVLKPSSAAELNKCNVERPKVMYNASTKEFVMWMHWENGVHYGEARAAVAYCSTPDGNFTYQGSFRPLADTGVIDHDKSGYMSRDCSVFVDTDGKGYFISAANENMDLILYELTSDYRRIASLKTKLFVGKQREAPCLIKRNDYYYLITSGCTGWSPNQGKYAYSKSLNTGWSDLINLGDNTTYKSQPAYIVPVQGTSGTTYLYTGDRWAGAWNGKVNDSQYVWLPLVFKSDTSLELPFYSSIKIDAAAGTISEDLGNVECYKVVNENSGKVLDVTDGSINDGARIIQKSDNGGDSQKWYFADIGSGYNRIINVKSGKTLDVSDESKEDGGAVIQWKNTGGNNQQWSLTDIGNGYYKIINRNSSKLLDVTKQSVEDGALVQQWAEAGGKNQHWKLVPVNVSVTQAPTSTPTKTSSTPTYIPGTKSLDLNSDGVINMSDVIIMALTFNAIRGDGKYKDAYDTNSDGAINMADVIKIAEKFNTIISATPASVQATPTPVTSSIPGWKLVWKDEFDDTSINTADWGYEIGYKRNNEAQYYTNRKENARLESGNLVIEARREDYSGYKYTSASINTSGKRTWQYGRFELRAKIPTPAGSWPAWWTLGVNNGWPKNGEIDIMEFYKGKILANVAYQNPQGSIVWDSFTKAISNYSSNWSNEFHTWVMEWDADNIKLYCDNELLNTFSVNSATNGTYNPFRQPHYMLINLAIGGNNGGDPSQTTFPLKYYVDYVRVYQKQ